MELLLPQEVEVHYIIPTIRKYFAHYLNQNGMNQTEISKIFGITKSAVSQYFSKKRGNKIAFQKDFVKEIEIATKQITDKYTFMYQMQKLLLKLKNDYSICTIHEQINPNLNNCNPELVGCHFRKTK